MNGAGNFRALISRHGTSLSQGWLFSSLGPFTPSRSRGLRLRSYVVLKGKMVTRVTKFAAAKDQPLGSSSVLTCACFDSIWSRISFLLRPWYGLLSEYYFSGRHTLPSMHSYAMTPTAK